LPIFLTKSEKIIDWGLYENYVNVGVYTYKIIDYRRQYDNFEDNKPRLIDSNYLLEILVIIYGH
jgi:hypothetical protein